MALRLRRYLHLQIHLSSWLGSAGTTKARFKSVTQTLHPAGSALAIDQAQAVEAKLRQLEALAGSYTHQGGCRLLPRLPSDRCGWLCCPQTRAPTEARNPVYQGLELTHRYGGASANFLGAPTQNRAPAVNGVHHR